MAGRHRKTRRTSRGQPRHHARHRRPAPASHTVVPALSGVAVIVAAGVIIGLNVDHGPSSSAAVVAVPTASGIASPGVRVAPSPHASVLATSTSRPQPSATLHFVVHRAPHRPAQRAPAALTLRTLNAESYVQVRATNGKLLARKILPRNRQLSFRRHGLDVVLGNAGAVRVAIDGHRAHRAGRSGQVVHFTVR